jgi:Zn-dependent protease
MSGSDSGTGRENDSLARPCHWAPSGHPGQDELKRRGDLHPDRAGLAAWEFPAVSPHQATATYVLAGILTTIVFLASLLAHELAHSLMARHYGLTVKRITLWLLGGVSELSGEAPGPAAEARIAGVGPLTSLLLGGISIGLAVLVWASHPARASIPGVIYFALFYLGITNVTLAVFNVLPAAPLDGGRLLRALDWWRTGDRVKATV